MLSTFYCEFKASNLNRYIVISVMQFEYKKIPNKWSFGFFGRWKECSHKNQLRYSESIKILKEMKELYDC